MSKDHPFPWRLNIAGLMVDATGVLIVAEGELRRRIVASVNACAGIPLEALEELTDDSKEAARRFFLNLPGWPGGRIS